MLRPSFIIHPCKLAFHNMFVTSSVCCRACDGRVGQRLGCSLLTRYVSAADIVCSLQLDPMSPLQLSHPGCSGPPPAQMPSPAQTGSAMSGVVVDEWYAVWYELRLKAVGWTRTQRLYWALCTEYRVLRMPLLTYKREQQRLLDSLTMHRQCMLPREDARREILPAGVPSLPSRATSS